MLPKATNVLPKALNVTTNNNNIAQQKRPIQLSTAVFHITPDVQSDIYNLYVSTNGKMEFYDYAFIPDYESSVKMNKLFRNIKENNNLDALEESDDEEEFENENLDKFVYLDKSYKMECQYIHKFKKWIPIKLADDSNTIISNIQLKNTYKFYDQNRKR